MSGLVVFGYPQEAATAGGRAVEAGETLGFLPGNLFEKVNPYLRPLYDALYDMMEIDHIRKLMDKGVIEIAPLAFMRGRTLNWAFVILDEADAPLDDANIERYLKLIDRNLERCQFVLMTHVKRTMTAADTIYGVTMERKGVSKVVSLKLDEVTEKYVGEPV